MRTEFFELEDDLYSDGRWYLNRLCDSTGIELDSREFRYGKPVHLGPPISAKTWKEGTPIAARPPLKVLLDPDRVGLPLDFTFTNADMPVVGSRVARILAAIAPQDIQQIPVLVESQNEDYNIINVVTVVDCIDVRRSEIQWYTEGNNVRPDKAGMPEMITKLVIDPVRAGEHHIFRIYGWEIAVVVSDVIKNAFEQSNVSGVRFRQLSPCAFAGLGDTWWTRKPGRD
jgi:hypothetical protein